MSSRSQAIKYLHDFTNEIMSCESIEDYYEKAGAVFIFSELIYLHFKEHFEVDDNLLLSIKSAAKQIAQEVSKESKKEEMLN